MADSAAGEPPAKSRPVENGEPVFHGAAHGAGAGGSILLPDVRREPDRLPDPRRPDQR